MARPSANAPCPCGSLRKAKGCCLPVLLGAPPPSPEALMRSRYTAYAVGDTAHLIRTTHPASPHRQADVRAWAEELRQYCAAVRFVGLTVHAASEEGDTGRVRFYARMTLDGRDVSFGEDSRFSRVDGRWTYVDGERIEG
ncbi:MAG: YchJ family metal-binding protein [Pseudomonadota bacterium]|nr:YchJ family metal-binding protein [Pseudomonadota bacterium]